MKKSLRSLAALALLTSTALVAEEGQLVVLYPVGYTLVQRDTAEQGSIPVRGSWPGEVKLERVEARFCGRDWQVIDPSPKEGNFAGVLREGVGQGELEVRGIAEPMLVATVPMVSIGDLFVITGQSNADGRGTEMVQLKKENPYVGVKYRKNSWSIGEDPSANDGDYGSPWPMVLNTLIPAENVPIGFIATAAGSTVVKQWRRGDGTLAWGNPGSMQARMLNSIKAATDGTMKVRAVLYYQGENDMTHHNTLTVMGDYDEYKTNLLAAITDFWDDLGVPVLVGQLTNQGSDREKNDNIRRAQQEMWSEHPHALQGAVTFDIFPTDGCHFRALDNMQCYADRWSAAILSGIYGKKEMALPRLLHLQRKGEEQLLLTFDQPMTLRSWDGKEGKRAEGFRFRGADRAPADLQVIGTEIEGNSVTLQLSRAVPTALLVDYGSGGNGQGQVVLRSAATGLPAPMLFAKPVE